MSERFIVAESSGYPMTMGRSGGGGGWLTEYMVLDTGYCHRVVWTSLRNNSTVVLDGQELCGRARAEEICRRFNAHGGRFSKKRMRGHGNSALQPGRNGSTVRRGV